MRNKQKGRQNERKEEAHSLPVCLPVMLMTSQEYYTQAVHVVSPSPFAYAGVQYCKARSGEDEGRIRMKT